MKPGRELDALVAEKVMGRTKPEHFVPKNVWLPHYSTDIAASWEVVEKMRSMGFYYSVGSIVALGGRGPTLTESHAAGFGKRNALFETVSGETAPHAVCLAALKAVGSTDA